MTIPYDDSQHWADSLKMEWNSIKKELLSLNPLDVERGCQACGQDFVPLKTVVPNYNTELYQVYMIVETLIIRRTCKRCYYTWREKPANFYFKVRIADHLGNVFFEEQTP